MVEAITFSKTFWFHLGIDAKMMYQEMRGGNKDNNEYKALYLLAERVNLIMKEVVHHR